MPVRPSGQQFLSVDPGEIEAARSLGMTNKQVYMRVIIPNAAVVATPSLINSLIGLTKGTSLAFSAGVVEILPRHRLSRGQITVTLSVLSRCR